MKDPYEKHALHKTNNFKTDFEQTPEGGIIKRKNTDISRGMINTRKFIALYSQQSELLLY